MHVLNCVKKAQMMVKQVADDIHEEKRKAQLLFITKMHLKVIQKTNIIKVCVFHQKTTAKRSSKNVMTVCLIDVASFRRLSIC